MWVMNVGELRIHIPDEIHQDLKIKAIKENKSLKQLVNEILEKAVRKED